MFSLFSSGSRDSIEVTPPLTIFARFDGSKYQVTELVDGNDTSVDFLLETKNEVERENVATPDPEVAFWRASTECWGLGAVKHSHRSMLCKSDGSLKSSLDNNPLPFDSPRIARLVHVVRKDQKKMTVDTLHAMEAALQNRTILIKDAGDAIWRRTHSLLTEDEAAQLSDRHGLAIEPFLARQGVGGDVPPYLDGTSPFTVALLRKRGSSDDFALFLDVSLPAVLLDQLNMSLRSGLFSLQSLCSSQNSLFRRAQEAVRAFADRLGKRLLDELGMEQVSGVAVERFENTVVANSRSDHVNFFVRCANPQQHMLFRQPDTKNARKIVVKTATVTAANGVATPTRFPHGTTTQQRSDALKELLVETRLESVFDEEFGFDYTLDDGV